MVINSISRFFFLMTFHLHALSLWSQVCQHPQKKKKKKPFYTILSVAKETA